MNIPTSTYLVLSTPTYLEYVQYYSKFSKTQKYITLMYVLLHFYFLHVLLVLLVHWGEHFKKIVAVAFRVYGNTHPLYVKQSGGCDYVKVVSLLRLNHRSAFGYTTTRFFGRLFAFCTIYIPAVVHSQVL
jgi:hypothetical protein